MSDGKVLRCVGREIDHECLPCKWLDKEKHPWPQATAELLENDSRTVAEGKGWFYWYVTGSHAEVRCDKVIAWSDHEIRLGGMSLPMIRVKIQPAPAPPEMEEC